MPHLYAFVNWVALVQVMACCLLGARPLPESMLIYCLLGPFEQTSVKSESKWKTFHSWKCSEMAAILSRGRWVKLNHSLTWPTVKRNCYVIRQVSFSLSGIFVVFCEVKDCQYLKPFKYWSCMYKGPELNHHCLQTVPGHQQPQCWPQLHVFTLKILWPSFILNNGFWWDVIKMAAEVSWNLRAFRVLSILTLMKPSKTVLWSKILFT